MRFAVLGMLHGVRTLRLDDLVLEAGAENIRSVLASMAERPRTARLLHLALHDLKLAPDDPQLVAAIQLQSELLVISLGPPWLQAVCETEWCNFTVSTCWLFLRCTIMLLLYRNWCSASSTMSRTALQGRQRC
jgi:hypothetical protein